MAGGVVQLWKGEVKLLRDVKWTYGTGISPHMSRNPRKAHRAGQIHAWLLPAGPKTTSFSLNPRRRSERRAGSAPWQQPNQR
uniref:Uncharacterized protein n=1 Tax=Leersia perrieri TaxID=77586 RepID=A0A0D9VG64_9ORYZ